MNIDNDEQHEHVLICPDCDKTPEELGYVLRQSLKDEVLAAVGADEPEQVVENQKHGTLITHQVSATTRNQLRAELRTAISTIFEGKENKT